MGRFIHRARRSMGAGLPAPVDTSEMGFRPPPTVVTCAFAVATALLCCAGNSPAAGPVATARLRSEVVPIGTTRGVLILPLHPHALAIVVHGGEIAWNRRRAALSTRVAARVYAARLAPLGLGVLSVDYRGSAYGGGELRDVEATLAEARRVPLVAALPKILIGASHGGYLAALAATTSSARAARVRAVVDLYGFSDLAATVSGAASRYDPQARLTLRTLGPPARDRAAYASRSPLSRASSLRAPLLQIVGGRDRVTRPDVLALTRAVRLSGGTAVLHVIPDSRHGFAFGTAASAQAWREVKNFLSRLQLTS
jgi:dipeptidyl aminopeptidase/acylaminoacyl peptidase